MNYLIEGYKRLLSYGVIIIKKDFIKVKMIRVFKLYLFELDVLLFDFSEL